MSHIITASLFLPLLFTHQSPEGTTQKQAFFSLALIAPVDIRLPVGFPTIFTSGWYEGPSQCCTARGIKAIACPSFLFLPFYSVLPSTSPQARESLSHLYVAELRVRTQHRAHGSLISPTSDHSSRSARQNSLKSCIWKSSLNPLSVPFFSQHKRVGKAPGKIHQTMAAFDSAVLF